MRLQFDRSTYDIMLDILVHIANSGCQAGITDIQVGCNIPFTRAKESIQILGENGYIRKDTPERSYRRQFSITQKGLRYAQVWKKIRSEFLR